MTKQLQIHRIEDCMTWLEEEQAFTHSQSVNYLINLMGKLCASLAFVNGQLAISKREYNDRKVKAYNDFIASSVANQTFFAPSIAKDYVNAKCAPEQFNFDLCERCSRSLTHRIDALRTAISALKAEMHYSNQ